MRKKRIESSRCSHFCFSRCNNLQQLGGSCHGHDAHSSHQAGTFLRLDATCAALLHFTTPRGG